MDKKFLHRVIDQIFSETRIDFDEKKISFPFYHSSHRPTLHLPLHPFSPPSPSFSGHCKDIYGLNEEEIKYVWNEYREIIYNKIESNGL